MFAFQYQVMDDDGAPATEVVDIVGRNVVSVLSPPTNLAVSVRKVKKHTYHDLSWDSVSGVTGYRVYTSSSSRGPWTLVADVAARPTAAVLIDEIIPTM